MSKNWSKFTDVRFDMDDIKNTNTKVETEDKNTKTQVDTDNIKIRTQFDDEIVNEKEPTPVERFLNLFNRFGDLFVLNIYFFVTCIPIVTIGTSFTALYTVTAKMVKNDDGPISKEYFKAFKANLKQGVILWLIDIAYITLMALEYSYTLYHNDQISRVLFIAVGAEFFLFALAFPLQFPLLSRYDNTALRTVFNALVLAFSHPLIWFKIFFIWMLPVVLYYMSTKALVYTWYLWGLILTALFTYLCSMFLVKFYAELEGEGEEPA